MSWTSRMKGLSSAQRSVAERAETALRTAGVPDEVIPGALANAWAESRLNPLAVGDRGKSVGIWQLRDPGAGSGMSVAARQDVEVSTRRIAEVYAKSAAAKAYRAGERRLDELSRLWCVHVERPSGASAKGAKRAELVSIFWPAGRDAPAAALVPSAPAGRRVSPLWVILPLAGILLAAARRLRRAA